MSLQWRLPNALSSKTSHTPATTEELCRAVCVGTSKLIELFRLSCGMTPQEYARDVRMHHACELLETTDLSPGRYRRMRGLFPSRQLLRSVPCPGAPSRPGSGVRTLAPSIGNLPKDPSCVLHYQ